MGDAEIETFLSMGDAGRVTWALDAYEYWELGDPLPRNNGEVFIPGDLPLGEDRYWDGVEPTEREQEAIDAVRACRELRDRLAAAIDEAESVNAGGVTARCAAAQARYRHAVEDLVPLLIEAALFQVATVLPDATALVTIGRVDENEIATLRVHRILGDSGRILASIDDSSSWVVIEDTVDEVGVEYLDLLLDLTGDSYLGESRLEVSP